MLATMVAVGCGSDVVPPLETAQAGVVFTYPIDHQVDVPLGTRIVATFSDPVTGASGVTLMGPSGPVAGTPEVVGDGGRTVQIADAALEAGTTYTLAVASSVSPTAQNLPAGPLVTFTTRGDRPRAAIPTLVAVNGGDPKRPDSFRPMLDTSTIRLVFSEPLDPRTVTSASVQLLDAAGKPVPATVLASDIHVAIDPVADLTAGATYTLSLAASIADLGGQRLAAVTVPLTPKDTRGAAGPIKQVLRTRQAGDPGPTTTRSGADANVIAIDKPIIGKEKSTLSPASVATELGDPAALDGPIAFTIRRGQRLRASGLDVKLGGQISANLTTGDIEIEFLTDSGGRLYRNPHQDPAQRPENERAPLYVDLSMDVAVYAVDPTGNAVLAQTVLGVEAAGTVTVTDGVLAIETMSSMELGLLGIAKAPTNLVLELITDASASAPSDTEPPVLLSTYPAETTAELPVDGGIELIFSEPIDLAKAQAGGIQLTTATGTVVPSVIESHGAAVTVRPVTALAYGTAYHVALTGVADVAGNALAARAPLAISTPKLAGTGAPVQVAAVYPGVPCALTGGTAASPGRCSGGNGGDDLYAPFTLRTNENVEVGFTQPLTVASVVHGTACNTGSVRIEEVDTAGTCLAAVPGTLMQHNRSLAFAPDAPWDPAKHYRLTLISGNNKSCDAGELCGIVSGNAASFDPLSGTADANAAGGPNLSIPFTALAPDGTTYMFAEATPFTDENGSGTIDSGEPRDDDNRAALRITGTTGAVGSAKFNEPDCDPSTPQVEACMYLGGALPVEMGSVTQNCPLPDGSTATSCVPVYLTPQAMYATSINMSASVGISISTDTGTSVMRMREPAGGGRITGYIIDGGGAPAMVVKLDLYMDAPDMSIPLSSHDLHSKPLSLSLKGPVTFLADGRIAIAAKNVADAPVQVNISAPLGISGSVQMVVPAGGMKLQLLSRPLRGGAL